MVTEIARLDQGVHDAALGDGQAEKVVFIQARGIHQAIFLLIDLCFVLCIVVGCMLVYVVLRCVLCGRGQVVVVQVVRKWVVCGWGVSCGWPVRVRAGVAWKQRVVECSGLLLVACSV